MKLDKQQVKRCGIYLFFDKDGIVDRYVLNMIEDLKHSIDYMLVVCNGYVQHQGLQDLRHVADEVICRANVGFDVGGYREGLFYLGWKELAKYDELVMLNYTFFGPIYPFAEMFDAMAERDISFWGPTKHHNVPFDPFHALPYNYLPAHIQSHFLVLRKDLFTSHDYRDFICNMKNPASYLESICGYEAIFTKHFEDCGYKWDVYVDTDDYEGYAYCPILFYAKELIEEKRCPIIKRRSFFTDYNDYMLNTCGEVSTSMYELLKETNLYDLNLIWDNILRLENMPAIHRTLHLNYMLETYASNYQWNQKIALVIMWDSDKRKSWYSQYFENLPSNIEVITYAEKTPLQKVLADLKDKHYDYIGVAHIMDVEQEMPYSNTVSWQYSDMENLFYNKELIGNLLESFEENPRMGMCIPPVYAYGSYFDQVITTWEEKYQDVIAALQEKGITLNIQKNEMPLAPLGGSFWMRGNLLEKVEEKLTGTDEEIELWMLPHVVQALGYYTGVAYGDQYAPITITNEDYMLRENNKTVFSKYGPSYIRVVTDRIRKGN